MSVPQPSRGWSQWINTLLLITVCALLKVGYDDFVRKQEVTNESIRRVNEKLSNQDLRMQKMEDYENIWLTSLPKIKEDVERHDRAIHNYEYRIESLEKRTNIKQQ